MKGKPVNTADWYQCNASQTQKQELSDTWGHFQVKGSEKNRLL